MRPALYHLSYIALCRSTEKLNNHGSKLMILCYFATQKHLVNLIGFEPIPQDSKSCMLTVTLQVSVVLHLGLLT